MVRSIVRQVCDADFDIEISLLRNDFIGFSCLVEIYPECSVVFLSRDGEKIGVFYFNVLIVEFTAVNLKIYVHDVVVI